MGRSRWFSGCGHPLSKDGLRRVWLHLKPPISGYQAYLLKKRRDELETENHRLREELKRENREWRAAAADLKLWSPPGHYHSPIVNEADPHVHQAVQEYETAELPSRPDLTLDEAAMLRLFHEIATFYRDLPFAPGKRKPYRYFYENTQFSYGDAITYFGMLRLFKPKRVIEVGSGYSSCLVMDTNDLFLNSSVALTFVEPYPAGFLELLDVDDKYLDNLIRAPVQDVDIQVFRQLEAGDFLFLDSSHVAKTASDVNDYLFRILPELKPGVIVHIHDIYYPFEYPGDWIIQENRSWNEAYLLRAFLQYNREFEVIYFNHFMYRKFPELLRQKTPNALKNPGAGIWLRRAG